MRPDHLEYHVAGLGIRRKDHDVWTAEHGHCQFFAQHVPALRQTLPGETL